MKDSLDSKETLNEHIKIIRNNKFLYRVYKDFYNQIAFNITKLPVVEIGSGAGFIKNVIPNTTTTDVIKGNNVDKVFYAEKIPFKESSIGSIVMLNVFHHIKNPKRTLSEMDRCLARWQNYYD